MDDEGRVFTGNIEVAIAALESGDCTSVTSCGQWGDDEIARLCRVMETRVCRSLKEIILPRHGVSNEGAHVQFAAIAR